MSEFSRANVMRNIQKIQDNLAALAEISLMLFDSRARELTIPSHLPARCAGPELCSEFNQAIARLINETTRDQAYFHRCQCRLHYFSFKTGYRINTQPVYLLGGCTERRENIQEHLPLILNVFSLPVNIGQDKGKALVREGMDQEPLCSLTPQEKNILALVGEGMSNKAIAGQMFISENTVKVHVSRLLRKLKLANRTEATLFAVKNNLLPLKND